MSISAPAGKAPAEAKKVGQSGWSKLVAKPGDELILAARLSGFGPGTTVHFKIFPTSGDPGAPLATLRGASNEQGIAFAEWVYVHDPTRVKDPRLIFEAEVEGLKTLSAVIMIIDWITLNLENEDGKPLAGKEVRLVDSLGYLHIGNTSPQGEVSFDKVACGDCMFTVKGFEIVGEARPGDKKFRSGSKHSVSMREMQFTIEFESPKDGEVYLAGDRIPVKAHVKRIGKPWEGMPSLSANNGARVIGGAAAGQDAAKAASEPVLVLPGKEAVVDLSGKFDRATASVKIKVVKPVVSEINFDGPDAFKLFDAKSGAFLTGHFTLDKEGAVKEQFPGAFRFGKKLAAKVKVVTSERLTKPATIEIALTTPPLVDAGLPLDGIDKSLVGKPLTMRLPSDKRDAGFQFAGGEEGTTVALESDRPLPNCVRSYEWNLDIRVNHKIGSSWSVSPANLVLWPKVAEVQGIRVNAVFNEGKVGDGKDLDPSADPLKRSEYDPFHVKKCCQWADGAFNLLMGGDRSIPVKLAENVKPYLWPKDYNWLRGKPSAEHPRPLDPGESKEETTDPTAAGKDPTGKNWGFAVLDHPQYPGGKPHQWASAISAALNTLGAKGTILYLRPRPGGAVNTIEHDPLTRGVEGFDPKKHWGQPFLAFVGVPVDKSRDGDLKGAKLHEEETFVIEVGSKKRALHKDAALTGHEKRPPDFTKLVDDRCRNGHQFTAVTTQRLPATFGYSGRRGQLILPPTGIKVDGELAVEIAIPATLYGAANPLGTPYGGQVSVEGPGGSKVKQLVQGAVQWKQEQGLLKTNKIELGEFKAGEYRLAVNAFFTNVRHHALFNRQQFSGQATVTVHSRQPGKPLPETVVEAIQEVGSDQKNTLAIKTSGKLVVKLIDGMLTEYHATPFFKQGIRNGPITQVTVLVDGKNARPVRRGEAVDFGDVGDGDHKLTFANPAGHWNWRCRVLVITNKIDKSAKPRPCPTCGAQANWGYKSAKTGKPVEKDAKVDDSGASLEGAFAQSIIYPCPNCKKTVHDADAECWCCGAKLQARKAEQRFGQPSDATASGGEKQEEKGKGKEEKKEDESTRPVGRYDLWCSGTTWHAVLTLGPEGEPSSVNFGYFHNGFSREDVKDLKWEEKTRTLTFTRVFENRTKQDYKLVFKPDGSFTGTYAGSSPAKGGVRADADGAPMPEGRYDVWCTNRVWHAWLEVKGDDPNNLAGWINFGFFHPGLKQEDLKSVKWDPDTHTLSFLRPGPNQRYFITFRNGGKAFYGTFSNGTSWYTVEGTKL